MIQDIVTLTLIGASAIYTLYNVYGSLAGFKAKKLHHCGGCSGCNFNTKGVNYS